MAQFPDHVRISSIINQNGKVFPKQLILLVITIEDRRFFCHRGFDIQSIARVFFFRMIGKKNGGASTIGQQLARTITQKKKKTIVRKINEIITSRKIDLSFKKMQIINTYLSIAYVGHGIIGYEKLADTLFDKSIEDLTEYELAIAAACLKYPYRGKNCIQWRKRVERRAQYAISKLRQDNWVKLPSFNGGLLL